MNIVKAFNLNGSNINLVICGTHKDPLFKASDIGNILEMTNIRVITQEFDDSEKKIIETNTNGGKQNISYLTEKGLYKVLFKSRKPIAIKFQNWVYEIIKEIRATEEYKIKQELLQAQTQLLEAEQKIKVLEENGVCDNKPCLYIYNIDTTKNIPELKIGYTLNLHSRIKPCKHGKIEFTHALVDKNIKTVENFIHELLSKYRIKDEVFSLEVEVAKLILLRVINTFELINLPSIEKNVKIKKLIDYDNDVIYNRNDKISTREISVQTELNLDLPHACTFSPKGKVLNSDFLDAYKKWKISIGKPVNINDIFFQKSII